MAAANEQDRIGGQLPDEAGLDCALNKSLLKEFEKHSEQLRARARARREAVQLKSVINDREEREQVSEEDMLGRRQPQDEYQGDVNLRTLRQLLNMASGLKHTEVGKPIEASDTIRPASM